MYYDSFAPAGILFILGWLVALVLAITLTIVLIRLMLAAIRTLNAVTAERTLRTDLLLGDTDTDAA